MSSKLESLIGKEGMTAFFTELKNALQTSGKFIPWRVVVVSTDGNIIE